MVKTFISNFHDMSLKKKIGLITAIALTVASLIALPVMAWFTNRKSIATVTAVNAPSVLYINAAHNEDIINLDLDNIDVSPLNKDANGNRIKKQSYVFCVAGTDADAFNLQLAYTTNNQFEYKLYAANVSTTASNGALTYTTQEHFDYMPGKNISDYAAGTVLYVTPDGEALSGTYKNKVADTDNWILGASNDSYKQSTYDSTDHFEKHAMPVYWQTTTAQETELNNNKEFCNYFIIEVSWENAVANDANYDNSNETDIIYITAKSTS